MDLDSMLSTITQENADMSDPRQHFAWALKSLPSARKDMGAVPLPPVVRPLLSELLWEFGYRHDPELQVKWLIPGDHPEGGYLNVPKIVDRDEYERWHAEHSDPDAEAEKWKSTAEMLLGRLDPKLAHRIESMTPGEKAQALEVQRAHLPAAFARLADLTQSDGEENTHG